VRAWLFAPDAPGASVVLLHGWRGSRSTTAHRAEVLARGGQAVLAPSLRAHGDSAGTHYDFGRGAWRDVEACVDALAERRPGRPIVLVGFSYGGAVAVEYAARHGEHVDALVLDSVFANLSDAVRHRCEAFLPPILEDLATWGLLAAAPIAFPELDDVSPERAAGSVRADVPVLILRAANDTRVTPDETARLARAFGSRATTFDFRGADHDRCFENDPELWARTVGAFLARIPARR
jgi:pimeloyl-ACP methyl ester carboxylesterase